MAGAICCDGNDVQWQCGACAAETCHCIAKCPASAPGGSGEGGHGGNAGDGENGSSPAALGHGDVACVGDDDVVEHRNATELADLAEPVG